MKRIVFLVLFILIATALFYISQDYERVSSALFFNGDILTMEADLPTAQAVFVKDGIIEDIGSDDDLEKYQSVASKVIDLKGTTLMPGFIDPHTHPAISSFFQEMTDLSGFRHQTNAQIWKYLGEEVKKREEGEWILCKGLDPVLIPDLKTPTKSFLDSIAPNNPVFISSQSLHSFWANSLAFKAVGVDKNTPDPSTSSYYEKDQGGELTGFFAEQLALIPFRDKITELQQDDIILQSMEGLKNYAKQGNTTIVAMGLTGYEQRIIDFYKHLSSGTNSFLNQVLSLFNILPPREPMVRHMIYLRFDAAELLPTSVDNGDDHFKILGVKFWYDGAPYTGSMYLESPYLESDFNYEKLHIAHGHKGEALMTVGDLGKQISRYEEDGWQVAIHSQGDQSTKEVLEAFEKSSNIGRDNRHRIEHCLLMQPEHLTAMKRMGIHPSFHINHLFYYGQALRNEIIGPERAEDILPVNAADTVGLIYTLHSDAPMFPSEPLSLIQTAVERKTKEGTLMGAAQAVSIQDALESMTINAAWQIKMEDKLGSLKKGKYADFVVLSSNPLKTDIQDLRGIKVLRTVVAGQDVYTNN